MINSYFEKDSFLPDSSGTPTVPTDSSSSSRSSCFSAENNAAIDNRDAAERAEMMHAPNINEKAKNEDDSNEDSEQYEQYEEDEQEYQNSQNNNVREKKIGNDELMVDTDEGTRVPVPCAKSCLGEAPYGAPLMGFNGKIAAVFDAFAYMPNGQTASDRPANFLPIVGLIGDDEEKNKSPAWKLFGRLREDVYQKVKEELGDINANASKPVVLVTRMRADNMALFSISQPHQMFAPSLWLATLPTSVMKVPMKTLEEPKIMALVLGDRARLAVQAVKDDQKISKRGEQMAMGF